MGLNSPIPVKLPEECKKAAKIFRSFVDSNNNGLDKVIPRSVLERARGFAVFTVVKAGFLFSARAGSGVVIARLPDGSWSAPSAIGTGGVGFGGQAGAEVTDFLIVLNSSTAVRTFMASGSMTIGGNLSVAVGPLGRNAEGSGSLNMKGTTAALYSYSKTKGLFGGISIEGSIIIERQDANRIAYGMDVTSKELLSGQVERPPWTDDLVNAITFCTGLPSGREWVDDRYGFDNGVGAGYDDLQEDNTGRYDRVDHDDPLVGIDQKNRNRSGSGSKIGDAAVGLPRSASYGGGYAFGEQGVGSFSSSAATPKEKSANRSRSGSLASVFKKDLMGNTAVTSGSGFTRPRSSTTSSSSLSKPNPGYTPFQNKKKGDIMEPYSPFDDQFDVDVPSGNRAAAFSTTNEDDPNPFESYMARKGSSTLTPDLDLSTEVISPWNNEKGLSPKPTYKTEYFEPTASVGPNRSRSSSLTTGGGRARSGSGTATAAVKYSSPLKNEDMGYSDLQRQGGHSNDLANRMDRLRTSSNASSKLHKSTIPGYVSAPEFDDYSTQGNNKTTSLDDRNRNRWTTETDASSSSKPVFGVRKELLDGLNDGQPRAIALFDFVGTEAGDLGMKKGDVIVITKQGKSRDEWWTGKNPMTGKSGIFPANHVELSNVPPEVAAKHNRWTAPAFDELPDLDHA